MTCAGTVCVMGDTGQLTMTCAGTVCLTDDTGQLMMTCAGIVCLTGDIGLVKAVLCAGLYPHVAKVAKTPKPGAPPYKSVCLTR